MSNFNFKIVANQSCPQSHTLKDDYRVVNIITATFVPNDQLTQNCYYNSRTGLTCGINFEGTLLPHYLIVDCDSQSGYSKKTIKDAQGRVWNIGVQKNGRKDTPHLFAYHWEDEFTQLVYCVEVRSYNRDVMRDLSNLERITSTGSNSFQIWKADKTQSTPYLITVYTNLTKLGFTRIANIGKNAMIGFDGSDNRFNTPYLFMANGDLFIAKYGYVDSCLLGFNPYMDNEMTYQDFMDSIFIEDNYRKTCTGKFHQLGGKYPEKSCKELFAIATKQTFISNGKGCDFWVRKHKGGMVAQMFCQIRGEWFEYEQEITALINLDQIAHELKRGCQRKALESMKDYNKVTIKVILRDIPKDYIITIADSTSTGNCEYGTKQFCEQFGLPTTEITFGELVAMPKFSQMCSNSRFIATLKKVVANIKGVEITHTDEEA